MSAWRRKALEEFPDLRNEIQRGDTTIYGVFLELLLHCREAHRRGNENKLRKIYAFAEWCHRHKAKDLCNAADLSFYEHLGDKPETLQEMHLWVKPDIFENVSSLIRGRVPTLKFRELERRFRLLQGSDTTNY